MKIYQTAHSHCINPPSSASGPPPVQRLEKLTSLHRNADIEDIKHICVARTTKRRRRASEGPGRMKMEGRAGNTSKKGTLSSAGRSSSTVQECVRNRV
ncbi:uncharacterized protein STEHIDRAFT_135855 [Stereum hirsutum FP-91666 SS1]|uniref:Uncharacterized protein n=1 Tax=Stereum hirsutum (strain FP-91666) TaxID=721885 RepID=R7RVQ3_STEHR|nr:uncharacterized protein STEHIDRAFT_135855 [Stereum hirsutum FP-91666 SS1]EIM79231.1 hypothetical protein STEHIDRAFT_135855 [Stereum hirsutum FP-91666 SS1]